MNKHTVTFSDVVRSRTALAGLGVADLVRKTKIPASTYRKHMADGKGTREQLTALHRVIHFDEADMKVYLEGR